MDTILNFFQTLSATGGASHALFLLISGATAFLFALGVSFLVLATLDPVRRRLNAIAVGPHQTQSEFAAQASEKVLQMFAAHGSAPVCCAVGAEGRQINTAAPCRRP